MNRVTAILVAYFLFIALSLTSVVDHKVRIQALEESHGIHNEVALSDEEEFFRVWEYTSITPAIENDCDWWSWIAHQQGLSIPSSYKPPMDHPEYPFFALVVITDRDSYSTVFIGADAIQEAAELIEEEAITLRDNLTIEIPPDAFDNPDDWVWTE